MKQNLAFQRLAVLTLALWAAACSDSDSPSAVGPGTGTAGILQVASGADQPAAPGTAVPVAPAVLVKSSSGTPLSGQIVRFAVKAGGGTITNTTATTNASGIASSGTWTLGGIEGTNVVEATVG